MTVMNKNPEENEVVSEELEFKEEAKEEVKEEEVDFSKTQLKEPNESWN